MSRTSVGAITLVDIKDGFDPITVILGNQNHSFAADSAGGVSATERNAFSCEVLAFLGVDRLNYTALASQPNETYKIISVNSLNAGWVSTINTSEVANQAVIKMTSLPAGVTDAAKATSLSLEIDIKNKLGNVTTVNTVITLNKAVQGAGGTIINLTPSRQTFQFNENNVTTDADILMPITTEGTTGTLSAFYSVNGGTFNSLTVQGNGANQAKLLTLTGNSPTITISKENFSTANVFSVRVSGGTGGVDVVSIAKIQDGSTGPAALTVIITSNDGGQFFKNNTGATKTLTARVFDNSDGSEISPGGITYAWTRDGSPYQSNSQTITVGPGNVDDGSSNEFACTVSVA